MNWKSKHLPLGTSYLPQLHPPLVSLYAACSVRTPTARDGPAPQQETPQFPVRVTSLAQSFSSRTEPCPPAKGRAGQTCSFTKYLFYRFQPGNTNSRNRVEGKAVSVPPPGPQAPPQNQPLTQHNSVAFLSQAPPEKTAHLFNDQLPF